MTHEFSEVSKTFVFVVVLFFISVLEIHVFKLFCKVKIVTKLLS